MESGEFEYTLALFGTYFKKDCGVCGKDRLCYGIKNTAADKIHGFICRRCKDKINTEKATSMKGDNKND